jgi:hypothetical protein
MPDGVNVDFSLLGKPPDYVGEYVNAFRAGRDIAAQTARTNALAMYPTNPSGAASGLIAAGDVQGGVALQNNNQADQTHQAQMGEAGALASGNMDAATTAAAGVGPEEVMRVKQFVQTASQAQITAARQRTEAIGTVALALKGDPANGVPGVPLADRLPQAQHALQQMGFDASALTADDVTDAGLATHIASAQTVDQILAQHDKATTAAETHRHNVVTENAPKFSAVGSDQSLVQTSGGSSPQPAGAGGGGGVAAAPLAGPVGDQMRTAAAGMNATPAESAYLNQAAIKESAGNPRAQNGSSTSLFQMHPDTFAAGGGGNINNVGDQTRATLTLARQNGPALQRVLGRAPTSGELYLAHQQGLGGAKALLSAGEDMTAVQALTPVYAKQYGPRAAHVATQAVVRNGGDANMSAAQFAQHVEGYFGGGGGQVSAGQGAMGGGSTAGVAPAAGGPGTVIFRGANVGAPAGPDAAAIKGLTGPAYLATLPGPQQGIVKALSEGRMPLPTGFAISKPYWQQTLQQLSQYDPTFDTANPGNNSRMKTRAAFTSGKEAGNITSINTVVNHLGNLYDDIDRMGNTSFQPFNALAHGVTSAMGNTNYESFETDKQAVSSEIVRTLRGAAGNEADIKAWQTRFDATKSPAQLKQVAQEAVHLIAGRLQPLADQYNQGMGTNKQPFDLLRPDGQAVAQRILGNQGRPVARPAPRPATAGSRVAPTGLGHLTQAQLEAQLAGH